MRVSEICVKRIRANQGLGVQIIAAQKFVASDNFLMGVGLCIMSQQKQDPFFDILVKTVDNTYV